MLCCAVVWQPTDASVVVILSLYKRGWHTMHAAHDLLCDACLRCTEPDMLHGVCVRALRLHTKPDVVVVV